MGHEGLSSRPGMGHEGLSPRPGMGHEGQADRERLPPPFGQEVPAACQEMEAALYQNALQLRRDFNALQVLKTRSQNSLEAGRSREHGKALECRSPKKETRLLPEPQDVDVQRGSLHARSTAWRDRDLEPSDGEAEALPSLTCVLRTGDAPGACRSPRRERTGTATSDCETEGATTTSSPLTAESAGFCDTESNAELSPHAGEGATGLELASEQAKPAEQPGSEQEPDFDIGQVVEVLPRTWAGMNKPGGVGRITKIGVNGDGRKVVNVKYVLSSTEDKNIDLEFVLPKIINDQANVGRVKRSRSGRQIQPVVHNLPEDARRSGYQKSLKKTKGKQGHESDAASAPAEGRGCQGACACPAKSSQAAEPSKTEDEAKFQVVADRQWSSLERLLGRLNRLDAYAFWQSKAPVPLPPPPQSRRGHEDPMMPECFAAFRRHVLSREYSIAKCRKGQQDLEASLRDIVGAGPSDPRDSEEGAVASERKASSQPVAEKLDGTDGVEAEGTADEQSTSIELSDIVPFHEHSLLESLFEKSDLRLIALCISWPHVEKAFCSIFEQTLSALRCDQGDRDAHDDEQGTIAGEAEKTMAKGCKMLRGAAEKAQAELLSLLDESRKISLERVNSECLFPGRWRRKAFPHRQYEKILDYVPSTMLADSERERIEALRKTEMSGFCGGAYNFDDNELQEEWMTGYNDTYAPVPDDDAIRKICVGDFLDTLCNRVVDRVLNAEGCLDKPVLEVASESSLREGSRPGAATCQLVEKPVWGMDSYTRRNIELSLMAPGSIEQGKVPSARMSSPRKGSPHASGDASALCAGEEDDTRSLPALLSSSPLKRKVERPGGNFPVSAGCPACSPPDALSFSAADREYFIEFVLLPAINSQPAEMASDIRNALKGLLRAPQSGLETPVKFRVAAKQLLRAVEKMGLDYFKIHPKGTGVVVTDPQGLKPHTLVNFYLGETFPSWRWGEKADGIAAAQTTLGMKPQLPDFYNILLERPKNDPKGWGLVYVDASRTANMSSSLSHSCSANCNTFIVGKAGRLSIALCTTRAVKFGEELTMDYNSVTSDENEWYSAICLCGTPKCRGSFLHFAAHDSYMQIVNKKYGPCYRFASLLRQSRAAKAGYPEKPEAEAILQRHGFGMAALGPEAGLGLQTPSWLRRFIADTLRYIEFERRTLPMQLMKATNPCKTHLSDGAAKAGKKAAAKTSDMAFGAISDALEHSEKQLSEEVSGWTQRYTLESADGEARQMMEQRAQSLMSALSRVRRVLALVAELNGRDFVASEVPLRLLTSQEAVQYLWAGPQSVAARTLSVLRQAVVVFETEHVAASSSAEASSPKKPAISSITKPSVGKLAVAAVVQHYIRRLEILYGGGPTAMSAASSRDRSCDLFAGQLGWARPADDRDHRGTVSDVASLQRAKSALLAFRAELRVLVTELASLERKASEKVRELGGSVASCANAKKSLSSALTAFRQILSPLALCDTILLAANTETFVTMNPYPIVKAEPLPIRVRDLGGENLPPRVAHQLKEFQSHQQNLKRRMVPDGGSAEETEAQASPTPEAKATQSRSLNPELVVIEHSHVYQRDFIFSQLMQWYNYGEGTRTPLLNGCVLNPNPLALLMKPAASDREAIAGKKAEERAPRASRQYSNTLRYSLLKCLLDEQSRTMPFPDDVSEAFGFPSVAYTEKNGFPVDTVFGSPVLDLVLSDSSGLNEVTDVLKAELKVDDKDIKEEIRSGELRMENSIPVQPATWVQCEDPKCMKWRKLPWWIEPDNLPDKWYCSMNEWCPELASCSAEEQKWDPAEEATVAWATGDLDKTALDARQSITVAQDDGAHLAVAQMPNPEEKFDVNGKLDVYCKRNKCWYEASILKIVAQDATQTKRVEARIKVHFKGWSKAKDEWIYMSGPKAEVGRVAPFRSRTYAYVDKHWSTCINQSIKQAGGKAASKKRRASGTKRKGGTTKKAKRS
mmetsp:Transcript_11481/g.42868  ORF Transcript_11481/g.42868 Transcript_11481/m.42868 type:complete len:1958 (-) Transcript_11481:262-6135(-)